MRYIPILLSLLLFYEYYEAARTKLERPSIPPLNRLELNPKFTKNLNK